MEQSMLGLKALFKIKGIDENYFLQGNAFYYNLWIELPPYFFIKIEGYKEYIKVSLRRVSNNVDPHDEHSLYGKYYKFLSQDPWDIEVRYNDFIKAFDSLEFNFMLDKISECEANQ